MKKQTRFPPGWNEARVSRVPAHYEGQADADAVADDEAAYRSTTTTVMKTPVKPVPTNPTTSDLRAALERSDSPVV